ncbi:hypothetical protein K438DRAFT_671519 [Mycena galopus ATCC 62051]|nr:hypothetical protein K438DRAFT_671519 [Mycena galopus ATCC 62051]
MQTDILLPSCLHQIASCHRCNKNDAQRHSTRPLLCSFFATMHAYCIFAVFALFQIQLSFASISVVTPASAIQCDPIQFSWQGGTGPWSLVILSSAPPHPTIEDLGPSAGPPFTWVVNIASGNTVMLSVQDSTGAIGQSSAFTITKPGETNLFWLGMTTQFAIPG